MPGREPEPPDLVDDTQPALGGSLVDRASLESVTLSEPQPNPARDVSLSSCRVSGHTLSASTLPALRAIDTLFTGADCAGATWVDARLVRCIFESCKCTGLDTRGGNLRDVRFHECKMPDAFMPESTLDRVWFESCNISGLDLSGSTLGNVTIRDCDARGLRLLKARITALDLRGSRIDHLAIEPGSVRHLIIDPLQAPSLAESLGARVIDAREEL